MLAVVAGSSRTVGVLLDKGANASVVADGGITALHLSIFRRHLSITKTLVKAGADIEARTSEGFSALHISAQNGLSEAMQFLIEEGADVNSRRYSQATPLYTAAAQGHVGALRVLLRAKADPRLARMDQSGAFLVPLYIAASDGLPHIVRELIRQVGVAACGGGVQALQLAAQSQHLDVMAVLMDAGVVDSGRALVCSARAGREASVKYLLRQRFGWPLGAARNKDSASYLNVRCPVGTTALVYAIGFAGCCSPRVVRMLVDVGADSSSAVRALSGLAGGAWVDDTPLALAELCLRRKDVDGREATEEQLGRLEAIRRLLMRVEAVHAVSWLWSKDAASYSPALQVPGGETKKATRAAAASTTGQQSPLTTMLPLLRRRSRRGVLLAPLFRYARSRVWVRVCV